MQTANTGDQNKPAEVPAQDPVQNAPAGGDKKEPTKEELKAALDGASTALSAAEGEIVRLKKAAKDAGQDPNANPQVADLAQKIETLTQEVTDLKAGRVPKEENDTVVQELQKANKKIGELGAALVSTKTVGAGEGQGGNQDQPAPKKDEESFAKTPEEVALLQRRGIDPKTGKKIIK